MVSAQEFNDQKEQLKQRYAAAGGNPHDLEAWEQGATLESQLEALRQKVEEQERQATS
jgi:hypothetical protein